ncbi:MAG TPA: penicillin-binding protein 2 [Kouleothrix sp.]|uniref:peptidoglycan D,D-transpeptidase FtsI family protein n=1 Tax=Kouleothrix sp. TaxID=2779161 RepID=UPI002C3CE774|nr:penicillin-binding protein 2 [Kouleothrix sp.]HRC74588.1 penicillin-binding protein 2 [Kouleothrix sp.]
MAARSQQLKKTARPVAISRWRINAILIVAVAMIAIVALRLGNLQVLQSAKLSSMANSEIKRQLPLNPRRGTIRDRAGNVLALDVDRESLFAVPREVDQKNAPRLALMLSGLLGKPAPDLLAALQQPDSAWVPLKRWLDPEIAQQVSKIIESEPGLRMIYEPRRVYPQGSFAAQTIGAVNLEGVGISGIEGYYNTDLIGTTGMITAEVDAQSQPIWIAPQQSKPASDGADLELTIDPLIQHLIEVELKAAIDTHKADGGSIIVLEPSTGAVRGMASYPTFDPNRYYDYDPEMYNLNPAIAKGYEPGSTFKLVTVAAGLQARTFSTSTTVDDPGVIERYGWTLKNWDSGGHGMLTPAEMLYYSSNVAALQFNELTGKDKFYAMVNAFGYGKATGIDLAGEGEGIVKDPNADSWGPLDLDTNAFGQAVLVTPLQQARMIAAIGNGGTLMRPYVVAKICHADNCTTTQPQAQGQPIAPEVASTIRDMIVKSANGYVNPIKPDTLWLVPGYAIGAKTGTSQIPDSKGGYGPGTIGSVAGLAPIEHPRYAILVKIDYPKDDPFGVNTALPVYRKIVEQLMRYERIAPDPNFVGPEQVPGVAIAAH